MNAMFTNIIAFVSNALAIPSLGAASWILIGSLAGQTSAYAAGEPDNYPSQAEINQEQKRFDVLNAKITEFKRLYADSLSERKRAYLATVYDDHLSDNQRRQLTTNFEVADAKVDHIEIQLAEHEEMLAEANQHVKQLRGQFQIALEDAKELIAKQKPRSKDSAAGTGPRPAAANTTSAASVSVLIDDFNELSLKNLHGGNNSIYERSPSSAMFGFVDDVVDGQSSVVLKILFDKKKTGGPYGGGGWCGFYTILRKGERDGFFDASGFKSLSFWVRGDTGGENFVIGVSDKKWEEIGDSLKSMKVSEYLGLESLSTNWGKVTIPLDTYNLDLTQLSAIAICFEGYCFPDGGGSGAVYIDDLAFDR